MSKEKEVVRLDFVTGQMVDMGLMTPNRVEEILNQHMNTGVFGGENAPEKRAHYERAIELVRAVAKSLNLDRDKPVFSIARQGNTLTLANEDVEWLYLHIDTYPMGEKLHEYISQVTRQIPSNGSDEMLKKIAPPSHMADPELAKFFMHASAPGIYREVKALLEKIMADYPCEQFDRDYIEKSTQFNVSRVEIPDGNINGENGVLYLEMIVADKGHWNVAGRIKLVTGWNVGDDDNWYEIVVHAERALGDEPRENAYPGKAGIYAYIPASSNLRFPDLIEALKDRVMATADQSLRTLINCVSARAYNKLLTFDIVRQIKAGAIDLPNPYGVLLVRVRHGNQELGAIRLMTQWSHVSTLTTDPVNQPDFLELIGQATLDPTAEEAWAKFEQEQARHFGGQFGQAPFGGQFGHRWGGGPSGLNGWGNPGFRDHGGSLFSQWRPFNGGGALPMFAEEASLSTVRLDSFSRILMATVENMPVKIIVPQVLGALKDQREQYNQAQHGALMYQFELMPGFGLAVRAVSQSGVTHFQQVFQC